MNKKERRKAYLRKYYLKNKEKLNAYSQNYYYNKKNKRKKYKFLSYSLLLLVVLLFAFYFKTN